jgi:hypothetical protein
MTAVLAYSREATRRRGITAVGRINELLTELEHVCADLDDDDLSSAVHGIRRSALIRAGNRLIQLKNGAGT